MERLELIDQMRRAPALRGLSLADLGRLAEAGAIHELERGEPLLSQGEPADRVYLLLDGQMSVRKRLEDGCERQIASRSAPDWLGEFAVFDSGERSASVVAESKARILGIPREAFLKIVSHDVDALRELLAMVIARLRESDTQLIESLGEQLSSLSSSNRSLSRENRRLKTAFGEQHGFDSFVGASDAARAVRAAARQAAESNLPVLITGETGTGKEIVARAIHAQSDRAKQPFVALNCAHLTDSLLESQLFGHARGAFTGAGQSRLGLVEAASGGTLFLDEIADMPVALQGALLRFLELGEFRRLGETEVRHAQVGVIAATHRDLDECVRSGSFRRDLMYRLDVMRVGIPPLRERLDDLPQLASHCLEKTAQRLGVQPLRFSRDALDALACHDFAGNVRELENEVERLYAVLESGSTVAADALPSARWPRRRRRRHEPGCLPPGERAACLPLPRRPPSAPRRPRSR